MKKVLAVIGILTAMAAWAIAQDQKEEEVTYMVEVTVGGMT